MTDKPTPTDAELKAMLELHAVDIGGIFYYARAVLAKWGQPSGAAQGAAVPVGYALVPMRMNREMERIVSDEDNWQWEDLLAAANAITESDYTAISRNEPTDDEIRNSFTAYGVDLTGQHLEAVREIIGNLPRTLVAAQGADITPEMGNPISALGAAITADCSGGSPCSTCPDKKKCARGCLRQRGEA